MVVRVRVKLEVGEKEIVTSALANSGFESEGPEVVLPVRVAERLNLYPRLPKDAEVEEYVGVGGSKIRTYVIRGMLKVSVLTEDKVVGPKLAAAVITPGESEVILSDKMMDELKIEIIRPGEGIWRFADDGDEVRRKTEAMEEW